MLIYQSFNTWDDLGKKWYKSIKLDIKKGTHEKGKKLTWKGATDSWCEAGKKSELIELSCSIGPSVRGSSKYGEDIRLRNCINKWINKKLSMNNKRLAVCRCKTKIEVM